MLASRSASAILRPAIARRDRLADLRAVALQEALRVDRALVRGFSRRSMMSDMGWTARFAESA